MEGIVSRQSFLEFTRQYEEHNTSVVTELTLFKGKLID